MSGLLETFVPERPLPEGRGMGKVDVDDAALALVRFAGGAIGTIEGTRFAPGRKNFNRFEVNGSRGSLAFDLERMNELELYEETGPESGFRTILATDASHPYVAAWWPPGHILGYEHTFVHTVHDFVQAARGRRPDEARLRGRAREPTRARRDRTLRREPALGEGVMRWLLRGLLVVVLLILRRVGRAGAPVQRRGRARTCRSGSSRSSSPTRWARASTAR